MTLWELLEDFRVRKPCPESVGLLRITNIDSICLVPVLRYLKSGNLDDDVMQIIEDMDELHQLAHDKFFLAFQEGLDGELILRVYPADDEAADVNVECII